MQHYIAIYAVSIKSNPQDAGNPNIPWNCTTLLQSSQSAAAGHLSVPHTHQPRPWVRGVKVSAEFLVGEEGCYHFLWGGTQHTHLTEDTQGHDSELEMGLLPPPTTTTKSNRVGANQSFTDIENYPESPNEYAIWISTLKRFEVSGIHLCPSLPTSAPNVAPTNWNNSQVQHSKEQSFYVFRNPYKEVLVCWFLINIFLFALTNFMVIVFHCKRRRPAVISLKNGKNRKERKKKKTAIG